MLVLANLIEPSNLTSSLNRKCNGVSSVAPHRPPSPHSSQSNQCCWNGCCFPFVNSTHLPASNAAGSYKNRAQQPLHPPVRRRPPRLHCPRLPLPAADCHADGRRPACLHLRHLRQGRQLLRLCGRSATEFLFSPLNFLKDPVLVVMTADLLKSFVLLEQLVMHWWVELSRISLSCEIALV